MSGNVLYGFTGAERAVDGRYTDLRLYGGECAVSYSRRTGEWRIDLEGVRSIHHIGIQYATHNRVWGTVFVKVYNYMLFMLNRLY